jgi:hypothetical protein
MLEGYFEISLRTDCRRTSEKYSSVFFHYEYTNTWEVSVGSKQDIVLVYSQ